MQLPLSKLSSSRGMEQHYPKPGERSILLVVPNFDSRARRTLGPAYLAATLAHPGVLNKIAKNSGFSLPEIKEPFHVRVLDLSVAPRDFDLPRFFKRFDPSILGVSAFTPTFAEAVAIAELARVTIPDALRIVGGYHPSAMPKESLLQSKFQIAAMGYGEETLSELAMFLHHFGKDELLRSLGNIQGIAFKDGHGQVVVNARRKQKLHIDDIPFPHRAFPNYIFGEFKTEQLDEGPMSYMTGTRGCPFTCKYCSGPTMHGRVVQSRSAGNILAEISELRQLRGIVRVHFDDEDLLLNRDREAIIDGLAAIRKEDSRFKWGLETRGDRIPDGLIDRMADSGLVNMALGLESGDEDFARQMKNDRHLEIATIVKNTEAAEAKGVSVAWNLMVGLPGQDWASIMKTAQLLIDHPPSRAAATEYRYYPGSEIASTLIESGQARIVGRDHGEPIIEMAQMTRGEVFEAVFDLEYITYLMMFSKKHPEMVAMLKKLAGEVIDKMRMWSIYEKLIFSSKTNASREEALKRAARNGDPLLGELFNERTKDRHTFMAMFSDPSKLKVCEFYGKYRLAINLSPSHKVQYFDPFLSEVDFQNATILAQLPFSIIRLFIMICTSMNYGLGDSVENNIKHINIEDDQKLKGLLMQVLANKTSADINAETINFNGDALLNGGIVFFMGIPFSYDKESKTLVVISPRILL